MAKSPCKVNLLLNILGKRPDGFHELETVMLPVRLEDELTVEKAAGGITLHCDNPTLPVDGRNLVVRAAAAFFHAAGIKPAARIHLRKRVPIAAGLGGGSANAAVTLLELNKIHNQPLAPASLAQLAATLGSDVPFFLQDGPALATGRGEIIEALGPFPALRGLWMALAHPGFGISTPWAYAQLAQRPESLHGEPGRARRLIGLLREADAAAAGRELFNSLEWPALKKFPLLQLFQKSFRDNGALGTLMSGSGSSTFALFASQAAAESALEAFRSQFGTEVWTAALPL